MSIVVRFPAAPADTAFERRVERKRQSIHAAITALEARRDRETDPDVCIEMSRELDAARRNLVRLATGRGIGRHFRPAS
jgi:hypothetical protein